MTELAREAGTARPTVDVPLTTATEIFSEIWYGQRPATGDDDGRMRTLTDEVRSAAEPAMGAAR